MIYKKPLSNDKINSRIQEYKPHCAGKDCNNIGVYKILIIYLNKTGLFCSSCKEDIENLGLVLKSEPITVNSHEDERDVW
ncbi:MAG: hypothetical protein L0H53_09365 [Candidatus Nitrosocosmicus sp.]|nr:hypothetical protein [Candidatus Nitrosocosmicus sp.]